MMTKQKIDLNQVWKVKDKRFERYVSIREIGASYIRVATCTEQGSIISSRLTRVRADRFEKAFALHA